MDPTRFVSRRALAIDASGIRRAFDLAAKLKDPINLSIGLPDFDVPEPAKQAAIAAIQSGQNRYTQTQGIAPLRTKLRQLCSAEVGRDVGEVLVTSGVNGGLMLAMMAVIDPGDELIFLDPYFVVYKQLLAGLGGVPVPVDSYPNFTFDAAKVEAAITPKTKAILVSSPANPTGVLMDSAQLRAAVALAKKHNLLLISDEIYNTFTYDPTGDVYTPAALDENVLVLRGFSKSHGMTGWRLGYAFGPQPVVEQMTKLQQYTYVCAPSAFQHAAVAALDVDMRPYVDAYRRKRDLVLELLGDKFEIARPGGAFYVFPKAPKGMGGTPFADLAIEHNVIIIGGGVFSGRDTHFRISYATTDEKLRKGCEILRSLA
jgi:aspartate aminotransferase/aminotransferase